MKKTNHRLIERRKFIRLQIPVEIVYVVVGGDRIFQAVTKNISADGLRFETTNDAVNKSDALDLRLNIRDAANPVHAKGRVIWKQRVSLEDAAPFDVGVEFFEIEEDNKNTFLKFLCDILYKLPKEKTDDKCGKR